MTNLLYWDSKPFKFYVEFAFNLLQQNFNILQPLIFATQLGCVSPNLLTRALFYILKYDSSKKCAKKTYLHNSDEIMTKIALNTN